MGAYVQRGFRRGPGTCIQILVTVNLIITVEIRQQSLFDRFDEHEELSRNCGDVLCLIT